MKYTTIILLLFIIPPQVMGYTMNGRVLRVDSGNTVTIVDANNVQHTIRLQDINAPEINRIEGELSRSNLQGLIGGKHVIVNYAAKADPRSPKGRVYLGEQDINLKQVEDGMAKYRPSSETQNNQISQRYEAAQDQAKQHNRGIWFTPRTKPRSLTYERRLVVPSKPVTDAKQHFPPLRDRRHFIFPRDPVFNADSMAQYAPLDKRARVPYGYWAAEPAFTPPPPVPDTSRRTPPPPFHQGHRLLSPPRVLYPPWQR